MTHLRQTPFYERQRALGANFVDRIGFAAAGDYGSVRDEHMATREAVGLFDVYYQVMIMVTGADARSFLDRVLVADMTRLKVGDVAYSTMCTAKGGIIDDLTVFCFGDDDIRLAPTPTRVPQTLAWLAAQKGDSAVAIVNLGYRDGYLSVQGPNSRDLLSRLTDLDLSSAGLSYFAFTTGTVADVPGVTVSRTGYSGELGYELFFPSEYATHIWDRLLEQGATLGARPCGLASLVSLRTEKKYLLYGLDITEQNNPIEAGLGWTLRKNKAEFVGRDKLVELKSAGTPRQLVLLAGADLTADFAIGDRIELGAGAGIVTSASKGFFVGKSLAMGYVPTEAAVEGAVAKVVGKDGTIREATVHLKALHDPEGLRARA